MAIGRQDEARGNYALVGPRVGLSRPNRCDGLPDSDPKWAALYPNGIQNSIWRLAIVMIQHHNKSGPSAANELASWPLLLIL